MRTPKRSGKVPRPRSVVPSGDRARRRAASLVLFGTLGTGVGLWVQHVEVLAGWEPTVGGGIVGASIAAVLDLFASRLRERRPVSRQVRPTFPLNRRRYCTLIAVDIVGFGAVTRDDDVQVTARHELYRMMTEAFDGAGVTWRLCRSEDRGDGALIISPPDRHVTEVIDPVFRALDADLRRYNKRASAAAQIRLRVAVHAGDVHFDAHGVSGQAVVRVFRLLDARQFKLVMAETGVRIGLIASDELYNGVIRHGYGDIDPALYRPFDVVVKETHCQAWVLLPQVPELPGPPLQVMPGLRDRAKGRAKGWLKRID